VLNDDEELSRVVHEVLWSICELEYGLDRNQTIAYIWWVSASAKWDGGKYMRAVS
jgi:hypothetical protein